MLSSSPQCPTPEYLTVQYEPHQTPGPHLSHQQGDAPNGSMQGPDLLGGSRDERGACVHNGSTAVGTKSQPCAHLYTVRQKGAVIRAKSPGPWFPSPKYDGARSQPMPPRPRGPGPSPLHVDLPIGGDRDRHVGEWWDVVCWVRATKNQLSSISLFRVPAETAPSVAGVSPASPRSGPVWDLCRWGGFQVLNGVPRCR